ncbi:MAG: O-antigen ligase family protein [Betaproteobacteria bacterium]|nr:O-antigen ligase family protein [Betaproteobacteria bacterium]
MKSAHKLRKKRVSPPVLNRQHDSQDEVIRKRPLLLDHALALTIFATITVFAGGWYSPQSAKWLPIALLSSICWLTLAWEARRGSLRIDWIDVIAFLLLFWVAISISWSADPLSGKDTTFRWAILTSIFCLWRRRTLPLQTASDSAAIAAGTAVVIAFLGMQIGDYGGYYNRNHICEMLLAATPFLFPLAIAVTGTRWRWGVFALAIAIVTYLMFFSGSKIQFAVWAVLVVFLVSAFLARKSWRKAAAASIACVSAVLLVVVLGWENFATGQYNSFRASFLPRAELTIDSFLVWLTKPVMGVGAGGFTAVLPYFKDAHASYLNISSDTAFGHGMHEAAEAAHNDILQFLANFGLVGVSLVGVGICLAWKNIAAWQHSPERIAGLLVVLTVLTNALIEFPMQMPASLLLFAIGLAWLLPAPREAGVRRVFELSRGFRPAIGFVAMIAVTVNMWWSWSYLLGQNSFANAISTHHVDRPKRLQYNAKAIESYPYEAIFRRQYLITLMDWDFASDVRVVPPEDYDRIFEVARTAGPETGTLFLRLHYLVTSDQYRVRTEEFRRWRSLLLSQSSRFPEVWMLEGIIAVKENDRRHLEHALRRYTVLTGGTIPENQAGIISMLHAELGRLTDAEQRRAMPAMR